MYELEPRARRIQPISLIPLINVVFLLLIFFMVAGTMETQEVLPLDFPLAESGNLVEDSAVTVVLGARDEILINDQVLSNVMQAEATLAEVIARDPDTVITIKADATLPAHRLITLMQSMQRIGGTNISLVTERKRL